MSVKHAIRPRGQDQHKGNETQLDFSSSSASSSIVTNVPSTAQESPLQAWGQAAGSAGSLNNQIPESLRVSTVPFIHSVIGELFHVCSREEIVYSAPWFSSLISYLGRFQTLDTAMSAYLLQMIGKAKGDQAQLSRSRDVYGRSLAGLQRALNHPVAWKSAETLAATMLCCLFELFAGTSNPLSWMMHAVGVSKLIQARGPKSFSTPFERASLSCFRPIIIVRCLFAGEDCFLNQPKWQNLSSRLSDFAMNKEEGSQDIWDTTRVPKPPFVRFQDGYYILLAKIPLILSWGYSIREERRHGITPDPARVKLLLEQAGSLRSEYRVWHERAVSGGGIIQPVEVPSADPTSPFMTVLMFSSPWIGSVEVGYWATMLILQEALNQCYEVEEERPYDEDNQELARNILRATEHVGRGIMGPYRIAYALRIAYDFVDLPLKMWVLSAAGRYSQQYAAASTETYPRPNAITGVHSFMEADDDSPGGGTPV